MGLSLLQICNKLQLCNLLLGVCNLLQHILVLLDQVAHSCGSNDAMLLTDWRQLLQCIMQVRYFCKASKGYSTALMQGTMRHLHVVSSCLRNLA